MYDNTCKLHACRHCCVLMHGHALHAVGLRNVQYVYYVYVLAVLCMHDLMLCAWLGVVCCC